MLSRRRSVRRSMGRFIRWLIRRFMGRLMGRLIRWLVRRFMGRAVGWSTGWSIRRFIRWSVRWPVRWPVGRLSWGTMGRRIFRFLWRWRRMWWWWVGMGASRRPVIFAFAEGEDQVTLLLTVFLMRWSAISYEFQILVRWASAQRQRRFHGSVVGCMR